ncbi:YkgJ family cysteine cluster protein [Clostridium boliviensis]|uniref:YkgJ family cysteine cluster protein n=1 Tax=Clostridium boliviensis TaxID=318465 RepID=A0ABU4GGX6_9CLOT|nr:YkgJ family cysteine cluster protein [Clostridium boliviensis]MDW2796866.1 YkgJ family cysteine cluster protein [Clostridium boliviensis]
MKREIDIKEISDGKIYDLNDMVKADCKDCEGCSVCCSGMGTSIVLDPLDVYRLTVGLGCTLEALLEDKVELNVVDGIVLPNIRMAGESESCGFLDRQGRCSIHSFRPGNCRLFPLGRIYTDEGIGYFLQIYECPKKNRTKIKVRSWLDNPDGKRYDKFVADWHDFLIKAEQEIIRKNDPGFTSQVSMNVLKTFYFTPYENEKDFYDQFGKRLEAISFL